MDDAGLIEYFLRDVARIEPIKGREEYLPLTRRIERGRLLLGMASKGFEPTFERVQSTLRKTLLRFNDQCTAVGRQSLIPGEFTTQIEEFLDNPSILKPLALAQSTGKPIDDAEAHKNHERLGWRCFYLLALFPPEHRADALTCQKNDVILEHFRLVAKERRESRSRLIEGTLRYLVRIAMSYMGRGLSYLELVQEGYFGLQHAADRFIEWEGAHFQQYAGQWIQQRMMRAIAQYSRLIRLPVHTTEKLILLKRLEREYENELILNPSARDQEIIERLGLSTKDEIENKPGKAISKLKRLREADARHYAIHLDSLAELIVDEESLEEQVELGLLNDVIHKWLQRFPEREREIVRLRAGLVDGEAKTLEDIGQLYGVTRERIRQIEANAYRRMEQQQSKYAFKGGLPATDHRIETAINSLRRSLIDVLDEKDMQEALRLDTMQQDRLWIEKRVDQRIMSGRRRMPSKRGRTSRSGLFVQLLSEAGQPLHYNEIHQRALALLPPEQHITKEVVYATLFYSDRFRLLGGGIFSLGTWQNSVQKTSDGHVLIHCPSPLMPVNAHPRAFLESILVAIQLVHVQPRITVMQFYEEMLKHAGRDRSNPQDAFDAWYVAGLHDYILFSRQARETMRLSIASDWKLAQVRAHCLNYLCRRLVKMPELLALLDRMATVDVPTLQLLLFGGKNAGFDLPLRLNMLAAFEAIRADGSSWRITDLGRAALRANPPQELPDFSVIESLEPDEPETDDWDDHLTIFTL